MKKPGKAKKKYSSRYNEGDYIMLIATLILTLFGLVMVFSASYYSGLSRKNDAFYYLKSDIMWVALGWVIFIVLATVDYHKWIKIFALPMLIAGFILLALIYSPESWGLTQTINNATRWINFKYFTVMPGELIKTCFIIYFAYYFSKEKDIIDKLGRGVLYPIVLILAAFVLIYFQPNFSTAGIVLMLGAGIMFVAGLKWRYILTVGVLGVAAAVGLFILKGAEYMKARLVGFQDPFADALGSGYQVSQGILAFGSGGVTGIGLGKSVQKALYLPEPMNDFILPIIGEELGFIGVSALIMLFIVLIWRLCMVANRAKDRLGMLLAAGVALHMGLQVIINIAVVTASFPPTGVVLPLISLGGTATVLMMAELGIVYNVSRQAKVN